MTTDTPPTDPAVNAALASLIDGQTLSEHDARALFHAILEGRSPAEQTTAALALIQARGVTAEELTGAARVMRDHVTPVPASDELRAHLVDTCGTGGAPKTFNISTAAALIAAGAGNAAAADNRPRTTVAKHGNRSRTGRGSAEVLAQLGINIDASPVQQARCLEDAGVCFSFAIRHHPAMVHAARPRKALPTPTVFNLLGPLTNPAGATRQLLGVYDQRFVPLLAETLTRLGAERAIVAHGDDGLDEITTTATTTLAHITGTGVITESLDPNALGLPTASLEDLAAPTVDHAADIIRNILDGQRSPHRDIASLNAAAAIVCSGVTNSIGEALDHAHAAIDAGHAGRALETLARVSHQN